jgi:tetratricopeptide (TPR) repeat protein
MDIVRPGAVAALLLVLAQGCTALAPPTEPENVPSPPEASAAERIDFYSAAIRERPRLYPAYTQLGVALLDRARETHDPTLLARARNAEETSLAIQPSYEALFAMTSIENFSHRFEDAIAWGKRAAAASIGGSAAPDPVVVAALVEAYRGFGRIEDAQRLLPPAGVEATDFHIAISVGRVLAEQNKPFEAAAAMSRASELARKAGKVGKVEKTDLAAWAETAAGGVLLDSGHAREAAPHLEAAAKLAPPGPFLRLHHAELAMAAGDDAAALATLEDLLHADPDPAIEALAAGAARKAGLLEAAERHFRAAEQGLLRAVHAKEVYTLEALAKLYLDAGRNLDEARRLARENLRWKRDRAARETLAAIEARVASRSPVPGTATPAPSPSAR